MMRALPDQHGHWGRFGGKYVPDTLMTALDELIEAYADFQRNDIFQNELK